MLTNRPMPVRAPDDTCPGTGRCFMSRTASVGEKRRVFAEVHIESTYIHISLEDQKHKYKNIYFA